MSGVGFRLFFLPPGRCDADRQDGSGQDHRSASHGVAATRQPKLSSPGETAFAARDSVAAAPSKARRLAKPPSHMVGQQGARSQMQGKRREGGHAWIAPVRRGPAALVLAALLAYNTLGSLGHVLALSVDVQVRLNLQVRIQGGLGMDGSGQDHRSASHGVAATRQPKLSSPGETAFAARDSVAAAPVRNRTTGGTTAVCGELEEV